MTSTSRDLQLARHCIMKLHTTLHCEVLRIQVLSLAKQH